MTEVSSTRSRSDQQDRQTSSPMTSDPCVYQCLKCLSILGDSYAYMGITDVLNIITLSAVTDNVVVGEDLSTSGESADLGSTYSPLICNTCGELLGSVYRTTPVALDSLRDQYSFLMPKLKSYTLGRTSRNLGDTDSFVNSAMSMPELFYKSIQVVKTLNERVSVVEGHIFGDDYAYVPPAVDS
eukprot:CFRG0503T1